MALRFLWIVAGLTMLVIAGAIGYRIFEADLMRIAMVPRAEFRPAPRPPGSSYDDPKLWIARPDIPGNPALWTPDEMQADGTAADSPKAASVFFIHPTSFLQSTAWNAPLDDAESQTRAALFVRSQASAFNGVGEIWAPKYRQATFGAFLTDKADAERALDFAYSDVRDAWRAFLRQAPVDRPIILAGHSQGSLHLVRLLREEIAGTPEAERVAAAYVIGWPISVTADLPDLGLPGCERPGQPGCILSWQSFGEPADPEMVIEAYEASEGPGGIARSGSPMLCVNPLTGTAGGGAGRDSNLGTLYPNALLTDAELRPGAVPARCDPRGLLLIGENPPNLGPYVLGGNNYHVYDYALFWANIRADAAARLAAHGVR